MRLKFSWVFYICVRKNHYFDNKRNQWVGLNFCNELLLYWTIASNINGVSMQKFYSSLIFFLCIFSCSFTCQHGKGTDNPYTSLPFLPNHKHSEIYLQFCIWGYFVLLLITAHAITKLLLSEIDQPLEISNFSWFVDIMSDLITAISHRQVVDLNLYQLSAYHCK